MPTSDVKTVPSDKERSEFRRSLKALTLELIRDRVLAGEYGPYNPADPRQSHWQAREANRYITDRNRAREQRPQWVGIAVSAILSIAALVVAILAYIRQ